MKASPPALATRSASPETHVRGGPDLTLQNSRRSILRQPGTPDYRKIPQVPDSMPEAAILREAKRGARKGPRLQVCFVDIKSILRSGMQWFSRQHEASKLKLRQETGMSFCGCRKIKGNSLKLLMAVEKSGGFYYKNRCGTARLSAG